jgi:hypothetical protein
MVNFHFHQGLHERVLEKQAYFLPTSIALQFFFNFLPCIQLLTDAALHFKVSFLVLFQAFPAILLPEHFSLHSFLSLLVLLLSYSSALANTIGQRHLPEAKKRVPFDSILSEDSQKIEYYLESKDFLNMS